MSRVKIRAYKGPLTVLGAGVLGFSLFCLVAAAALTDPRVPSISEIEPQNIVDSAVSNLNTVAALTVEVITQYVFTATSTTTPSVTPQPTDTATFTIVPHTRIPPTRTRRPGPEATSTPTPTRVPTSTPTDIPTSTLTTSPTNTPTEVLTSTPTPTDTPTEVPTSTPTDGF